MVVVPASVPGVADVELLGEVGAPPRLVVEVPHGADRREHYQALRALMAGPLPADLHEFFFVNTDVGAWQVGRRVAERVVAGGAAASVVVVRSLIPRTFIDCNRVEDATEDLAGSHLTGSIPAYIVDAGDRAALVERHRRYVAVVESALSCLPPSGFLFVPHTYGPVSLGIERIDEHIVTALRRAHEPEKLAGWPVRPDVDLITRTADGKLWAAEDVADEVAAAYRALGLEVGENASYHLHPATLGLRWATRVPGRSLSLEIRRDRLCPRWTWNAENEVDPAAADRFAAPIAGAIGAWLARTERS
jgi:predicted N-formylglutamate amidohydrolase